MLDLLNMIEGIRRIANLNDAPNKLMSTTDFELMDLNCAQ